MTTMAYQITSLTVVYSIGYSGVDQRNHQSPASLAFVWGIHRDRWIPRIKGQWRGKCFHLMTSSCDVKKPLDQIPWQLQRSLRFVRVFRTEKSIRNGHVLSTFILLFYWLVKMDPLKTAFLWWKYLYFSVKMEKISIDNSPVGWGLFQTQLRWRNFCSAMRSDVTKWPSTK